MIRLTAMLVRNPALGPEEFQDHWANTHGPLIRSTPGIAQLITRYEQHPRLVAPPGTWVGDDYDGITVQLFRSREDLAAMVASPDYRSQILPDERYLLDLERSAFLLTEEPRVVF